MHIPVIALCTVLGLTPSFRAIAEPAPKECLIIPKKADLASADYVPSAITIHKFSGFYIRPVLVQGEVAPNIGWSVQEKVTGLGLVRASRQDWLDPGLLAFRL